MQTKKLKSTSLIAIIAVIVIGIILGAYILRTEKPASMEDEHADHAEKPMETATDERPKHGEAGHDHEKDHLPLAKDAHEQEHTPQAKGIAKGPHGGKLFTQNGYGVEVTIFEQNVPPEFRVYTYQDGKPLDPATSNISIQLERLGSSPQPFSFTKENDYLKGNAVVVEPHSFKVNITANHNSKSYKFDYEQIEARVHVTDKQLTLNSIEVLTAGPAKIKSILHLQGEIKLNADKSVHIVPRVGGIVESVAANAGDKVRKGQVLASISSQPIADMRSDLLTAQKRVGLARSTFIREKQLWEDKISAEQDYLQAQHDLQEAEINAARIQQKLGVLGARSGGKGQARFDIRSPIDGVVTNKNISQGQIVSEIDSVFEVSDLSSVWAEMMIYAKDINTVKVGQKVTIKVSAFDAEAVGTISYVGALVGEQSRTAMARVVLNNSSKTWLPGLPVNIELISDEIEVPLAVSVEGIQTLRDWTVVFGRYGEYFEARPIELGRRDVQYVEVLQGLNAGDKYAAGNSFLIKADIGKSGATHDH
jgi:cobalt-zinc-cadmium efflux system membrane fusion protein